MEQILCILATWRLTSLLVREDGPFDILGKFRHLAGVRYDQNSKPYPKYKLSGALICFWCASVWVALAVALIFSGLDHLLINVLAFSGGAILLDELTGGK